MTTSTATALDALVQKIGIQILRELPGILQRLIQDGLDPTSHLYLDCMFRSSGSSEDDTSQKVASLDLSDSLGIAIPYAPQQSTQDHEENYEQVRRNGKEPAGDSPPGRTSRRRQLETQDEDNDLRPNKRRATGALTIGLAQRDVDCTSAARRLASDDCVFLQRKKRQPENPSLQPSTLDKFVGGVWESIFSNVRMDPAEVISEWQAIESSGQPKLLLDTDSEIATRADSAFGRINILTRKISQTSRACRSLEVIVQAHWIQAFEDRVADVGLTMTKDKAKKIAMSQACTDFDWSEKELRNKMGVWRGYHDIKCHGGWAALVFAGMGLYRFCKYRVAFTDETFAILRALRHRFEVAADTLHPRWRSLLAIVGVSTERKYSGHPHDWVVCGPADEAIPLPITYHKWDKDFRFTHLDDSVIDEEAWGLYDPRTVVPASESNAHHCTVCGQQQSDDAQSNGCACFPNLYGSTRPRSIPVQVYCTPNGKNNGLIACLPFERGSAIGEFIGQITSGLANKDVMYGQTERATYQIFQGRQGNYSKFINHSCGPNSQFERFIWLGTERTVLVSKGISAGEEITVNYGDTYWKDLDKECLCGHSKCRFRNRNRSDGLPTPPQT